MASEFEQVDDQSFINDIRSYTDFKTISFSGYKKTDVKKEFINSLYKSKIEHACYWGAELVCAGHYMDLWEIVLLYLGKYIHLGNPKLAIYLDKRFQVFRNIMIQGLYYDELQLRNSPTIRNMFAEISCVLALSPKKPSIEPVKIKKEEEFDMTQISLKLKAPSAIYGQNVMRKQDPKELTIAINEFAFHISSSSTKPPNMAHACYWVEWLISFDQICKKKKQPCLADTREKIPVEHKYQKESIWIVWDAIFYYAKDDTFTMKILNSVLNLFCLKFVPACIRKRVHLLYFAIALVTEPYRRNIPMIEHKDVVENTLAQIHTVYKQIKKSEESPQTDYLFAGLHNPNHAQKSIQKMEMLYSMAPPTLGVFPKEDERTILNSHSPSPPNELKEIEIENDLEEIFL